LPVAVAGRKERIGGQGMFYEKPKCQVIGQDGNIFNLMGIAGRTLKSYGLYMEAEEMYQRITTYARSYDEALCIMMEYVDFY
jgi:N-formylglutamate amidohydrolase